MITAKVFCGSKKSWGDGSAVTLVFAADYADGRNKEWSVATPALSLTMTVTAKVAEQFEAGKAYTLQFVPE